MMNQEVIEQIKHAYDWGVFNGDLRHNLHLLYNQGMIDLDFDDMNIENKTWGGAVNITLKKGMTTNRVVNEIIYYATISRADEISMKRGNVLRIWWD
jgi:exoribonuclease R